MQQPLNLTEYNMMVDLDTNDTIMDVVVILRKVNPNVPHDTLTLVGSPDLSWIMQIGMVNAAANIVNRSIIEDEHQCGEE